MAWASSGGIIEHGGYVQGRGEGTLCSPHLPIPAPWPAENRHWGPGLYTGGWSEGQIPTVAKGHVIDQPKSKPLMAQMLEVPFVRAPLPLKSG